MTWILRTLLGWLVVDKMYYRGYTFDKCYGDDVCALFISMIDYPTGITFRSPTNIDDFFFVYPTLSIHPRRRVAFDDCW